MPLFSQTINLSDTFGALMIGAFVSAVLLGGIYLQAYYYFTTYSDGPLLQITVIALVILETVYVCLGIHAVNHYLVINYLNPLALLKSVWSIDISFGLIGIVVLIVHLSYAYRIYHVSGKKRGIPLTIVVIALAHFGFGWILVADLFRLTSIEQIPGFPETLAKVILSSAAAIDITIAATLSVYLHKKRTGFRQTDRLINRLIKYTINNGALTSVMDLITLALVIGRPRDFLFFVFSQILSALYSNSLLATFNSRRSKHHVHEQGQDDSVISSPSFKTHSRPSGSMPVWKIGTGTPTVSRNHTTTTGTDTAEISVSTIPAQRDSRDYTRPYASDIELQKKAGITRHDYD